MEQVANTNDFELNELVNGQDLEDELLNQEPRKQTAMVRRNIGQLYAVIARGEKPGEGDGRPVGFGEAARKHEFLERVLEQNK